MNEEKDADPKSDDLALALRPPERYSPPGQRHSAFSRTRSTSVLLGGIYDVEKEKMHTGDCLIACDRFHGSPPPPEPSGVPRDVVTAVTSTTATVTTTVATIGSCYPPPLFAGTSEGDRAERIDIQNFEERGILNGCVPTSSYVYAKFRKEFVGVTLRDLIDEWMDSRASSELITGDRMSDLYVAYSFVRKNASMRQINAEIGHSASIEDYPHGSGMRDDDDRTAYVWGFFLDNVTCATNSETARSKRGSGSGSGSRSPSADRYGRRGSVSKTGSRSAINREPARRKSASFFDSPLAKFSESASKESSSLTSSKMSSDPVTRSPGRTVKGALSDDPSSLPFAPCSLATVMWAGCRGLVEWNDYVSRYGRGTKFFIKRCFFYEDQITNSKCFVKSKSIGDVTKTDRQRQAITPSDTRDQQVTVHDRPSKPAFSGGKIVSSVYSSGRGDATHRNNNNNKPKRPLRESAPSADSPRLVPKTVVTATSSNTSSSSISPTRSVLPGTSFDVSPRGSRSLLTTCGLSSRALMGGSSPSLSSRQFGVPIASTMNSTGALVNAELQDRKRKRSSPKKTEGVAPTSTSAPSSARGDGASENEVRELRTKDNEGKDLLKLKRHHATFGLICQFMLDRAYDRNYEKKAIESEKKRKKAPQAPKIVLSCFSPVVSSESDEESNALGGSKQRPEKATSDEATHAKTPESSESSPRFREKYDTSIHGPWCTGETVKTMLAKRGLASTLAAYDSYELVSLLNTTYTHKDPESIYVEPKYVKPKSENSLGAYESFSARASDRSSSPLLPISRTRAECKPSSSSSSLTRYSVVPSLPSLSEAPASSAIEDGSKTVRFAEDGDDATVPDGARGRSARFQRGRFEDRDADASLYEKLKSNEFGVPYYSTKTGERTEAGAIISELKERYDVKEKSRKLSGAYDPACLNGFCTTLNDCDYGIDFKTAPAEEYTNIVRDDNCTNM
jgi:hypothetical protein